MSLEIIPFGGLESRTDDNLSELQDALIATDCILDTDAIVGRPGYRDALNAQLGSAGNTAQGLWRFRPAKTSKRTIAVVGGAICAVSDPSSDLNSDGSSSTLATPFADIARVSGAQLGTNFYLATDEATVAMRRVEWTSPDTYVVTSLEAIPAPDKPLGAVNTTLSWSLFSALTPSYTGTIIVQTSAKAGFNNMDSAWRGFAANDGGNDDPIQNTAVSYDVTTPFDATTYDWVVVTVSPHDEGGSSGTRRITVQVSADNSVWYSIGSIWDVPPVGGSPNVLFCDLRNLLSAVRSSIRYWKFLVEGASGGKFIIYGYMFLPTLPKPNPPSYYVDFFNSATGQQSAISSAAQTSGLQPLTVPQANPAPYPDSYMTSNSPTKTGSSLNMFNPTNPRVFNKAAGIASPTLAEIGGIITVSGTTSAYTGSLTVRLWQDTANGRRLVTTISKAASTAYSFTIGYSDAVLANQLYRPGGVGPRLAALGARAGRLIGLMLNRCHISSFTPTSDKSNPYVQWPDIATEDSDGWSFDFAPGADEQGCGVDGHGDSTYLLSNYAVYSLSDLRPNSIPYKVFQRGCVSRAGYVYAEDRLFWLAWDGLYMAINRSRVEELSLPIRRLYRDTFLPDSNACIGYDATTRSIIIIRDNMMLRYCFAASKGKEWTGPHTLADNVRYIATWLDPA